MTYGTYFVYELVKRPGEIWELPSLLPSPKGRTGLVLGDGSVIIDEKELSDDGFMSEFRTFFSGT